MYYLECGALLKLILLALHVQLIRGQGPPEIMFNDSSVNLAPFYPASRIQIDISTTPVRLNKFYYW